MTKISGYLRKYRIKSTDGANLKHKENKKQELKELSLLKKETPSF